MIRNEFLRILIIMLISKKIAPPISAIRFWLVELLPATWRLCKIVMQVLPTCDGALYNMWWKQLPSGHGYFCCSTYVTFLQKKGQVTRSLAKVLQPRRVLPLHIVFLATQLLYHQSALHKAVSQPGHRNVYRQ